MTTVQEIKDHVQRQFGDDSGAQILDADYYRWVNEGQLEIFRRTESSIQTPQTTASVVGQSSYSLPSGFLKAIAVSFSGTMLSKATKKDLDIQYPTRSSVGNAFPTYFAVDQGSLIIFPAPDRVANIVLEWHGRPTPVAALSDPLTISDTYLTTLKRYVLAMAMQLDGNLNAYSGLMAEVSNRLGYDFADAKDPYDDYYPFITYIDQEC